MFNNRMRYFVLFALAVLFACCSVCSVCAEGGQVSGMAFADKNANGVFDEGERPMQNTQVTLCTISAQGESEDILTVKTGKDGLYAFAVADAGMYQLRFELPKDYRFTIHGDGSAAMPAKGEVSRSLPFVLNAGDVIERNVGAVTGNSYVSIVAFEDENANGGRRDSEPLVRYVKVELYYEYEGESYLIAEAVTDKKGETSISAISPGTYYIKATLPENYVSGPMGTKMNLFYNFMQPSIDNVCYSPAFEVANKSGAAMGIGMVKTGSLNGTVWTDKNGDRVLDETLEMGCNGIQVSLSSQELNITRTADVQPDGSYAFTGLQPADYQLTFTLPEGYIFSDSSSSLLQDIASSASVPVTVEVEKTTSVSPVGAASSSCVEIKVADAGRENALLSGVEATVQQNGKTVSSAVSDENGLLHFPIVRGGEATVSFLLPDGYVVSENSGVFPYQNGLTQGTFVIDVPADNTLSLEASAVESVTVSGVVLEDPTNTGIVDASNAPLTGFAVQAVDQNGTVVAETVTGEDGSYTIGRLVPGEYTLRFQLDDRYIATPYAADRNPAHNAILTQQPEYGETSAMAFVAGEVRDNVNAALFKAGIADGYVLLNPSLGELTAKDGGMENITVTLLKEDGTPYQDYAYSITDENGYFCIKGILPGNYMLEYTLPENAVFTNPAMDMDTLSHTGEVFTVSNGSEIHASPVGGVWTASFSGKVVDYTSKSGVSATISMTDTVADATYTAETDENGVFTFPKLMPNLHTMEIDLHDGYVFADSADSVLPYLNDSHAAANVKLAMGTVMTEDECTIVVSQPVDWTVQLYFDENVNLEMDETEPAVSGRTVELYLRDDLIATAATDDNGQGLFAKIIPAAYTLRIPLASEREVLVASPDTNECTVSSECTRIGLVEYSTLSGSVWSLDGTENGIAGIPISLLKDGEVIATCTSGEKGEFVFDGLLKGEYTLEAQLQEGYLFARAKDAAEKASVIISQNNGTPQSTPITLSMGQVYDAAHIGIGGVGAIGDTAWIDENKNGMLDIGEPLLPGVEIELYQYGELIASTKTDVYGRYALKGLYPGVYEMHVTMPKEVKPTIRQTEFPLVASILPESDENTVIVEDVVVPSMGRDLNVDMGFVLKKKNVYPASIKTTPTKDWTPYHQLDD